MLPPISQERCPTGKWSRRRALTFLAGLAGIPRVSAAQTADPVADISREVVLRGRDGGGPTWFHPRACLLPGGKVFMTLQEIAGSDYFGPVHFMQTDNLGKTWSSPTPVPPLGRVAQAGGVEEGVCDVVPQFHAPTEAVLALGHNVFYSGPKFSRDQPPRWPVYAVWKGGEWGPRHALTWDDPRGSEIFTNNCGQRVIRPDGDIMMSFTFGVKGKPRAVCGVLAGFDGETLTVKKTGAPLELAAGRGLLEPSLTTFKGRYFLTIRAEDDHGYVSVSEDGLDWAPQKAWAWDDGEAVSMSTTQQHWLTHSEALYLVYTRKDAQNAKVMRWRSPLWMAQVDPVTLRLKRSTERIVFPLVGDGVNDPNKVALMGNFHVTNVSPHESWVTVGEWQPRNQIHGDLLLARIRWASPNESVLV
ncbi:MAG: exo-alpha-sialidase [Verrucomicrobiaceae bacterium]|nr:exo-alpha-sialidase [Verrucomicrobiaceae bacterium]